MSQIMNQIGSTLASTDQNFLKSLPKMIGGISSGDKKLITGAGAVALGGEVASKAQGENTLGGQVTSVGSKVAGLGAVSFVGKDLMGSVLSHSPMYLKSKGQQVAKEIAETIKTSSGRAAGSGSAIMNLAEKITRGSASLM